MNTPQAPAAPDPVATAKAQTESNKQTALQQQEINMTNQVNPYGSLSYKQTGTYADGTPIYTQTTTLSPEQQSLYDKQVQTQGGIADIGNKYIGKISDTLATPFKADQAISDKITSLGQARLDPQFQREGAALDTQLINKGIRPGSQAWNDAHTQFSQQKNDAYNQLYLSGDQQAFTESMAERNQPFNEIASLLSGSQVTSPTFGSTPTAGVAPTDVIGAQGQSLAQQNVGYQANLANNQAITNGLFGLGKAAVGGWAMSDIETKENIEVVGERADGLHVIDFDYKPEFGGGRDNRGLIAQEVAQVYPDAVARNRRAGGLMAVNYDRVPAARGFMAIGRAA